MRILYFSRDYSTHDHRFLSALSKTEHRIFFMQLERSGHVLEKRPLPPLIEKINWRGGTSPVVLKDGFSLLSDLRRVIRTVKPDLIQAGPLQRSAFLTALSGFRPLVSMSWGYDLLIDAHRNAAWRWATRFTLKHSAALVGDCQTIRQIAISLGMPDERIVTFPWGIDLHHFSPAAENVAMSKSESTAPFTILSTRNWEPLYGVETIARAFVIAAQQRPDLRLVMLGNGSQAALLRRILDNPSAPASSPGQVLFPGHIGYDELPRYYRSADLYIAATHSDGASISLLEALACGLPALVSDIPGNREWIQEGVNGWLFPPSDVNALAQAMVRAVDARQSLPEMGRAARRCAERRADWEKNFPQLFRAYAIACPGHT